MNYLETNYSTHDGLKLYLQAWIPEQPKASLLLVHGLGEHSSRYVHFADRLIKEGIAVFTFDGRGHGKSSQPRPTAYFANHEDYLKDIDALFGKVKSYLKDIPIFIFGHSMGGGLVAKYVISYQPDARGVILSAAALKPADNISKSLIAISSLVSKVAPKLKVLKLDSSIISHDPEEVKKYNEDPLVYSKAIPARTGFELLRMMREIEDAAEAFKLPVFMLHGTDDQLTNPMGTEMLFRRAETSDKTYNRYPGLYHELLNEFEKEQIMDDIIQWIKDRI
ncbi:alpha/beta hydrolase [Belliella pelovolcani]|uniref:Monoacylglycerol lipase n=1 Tax=Belliella pelovolcani TaxID=529505 RepID=A0A1N7LBI0_9BACT|nr:alpha/beta hydrolase [Belliella pelovolcani]SIS71133.1 Lysophospholipase, alpha-beta hydrolase superfamily [Belliella pelovolcani]